MSSTSNPLMKVKCQNKNENFIRTHNAMTVVMAIRWSPSIFVTEPVASILREHMRHCEH